MTAFVIQTLLLTVPAFFIGAALACALRRALQPAMADVAIETRPLAPAAVAAPAARSVPVAPIAPIAPPQPAAAAAPQPVQRATPVPPPVADPKPMPTTAAAPTAAQAIPTVAPTTAANRFDESLKARPAEPTRAVPPPPATDAGTLSTLARAAEAAAANRAAEAPVVAEAPAAAAPAPQVTPRVAPAPSPALSTLARTAEAATATAAATAAVAALAEAARARVPDIVPDKPQVTATPRPPVSAEPIREASSGAAAAAAAAAAMPAPRLDAPAVAAGIVVPVDRAVVVPTVTAASTNDDLTRINGIDAAMSEALGKLDITRFSQIAAWRRGEIDEISHKLGFDGRIEQQNWIEQAQVLAAGGNTQFSSRRERLSEVMATAPDVRLDGASEARTTQPAMPAPATTAPAMTAATTSAAMTTAAMTTGGAEAASAAAAVAAAVQPPTMPDVSDRAAFATEPPASARDAVTTPAVPTKATDVAAAPPAVAPSAAVPPVAPVAPTMDDARSATSGPPAAVPIRPAASPDRDPLERIRGISPEIERLLNGHGVNRYSQIAAWMPDDVARFDRLLGSDGRIGREQWVEQAQMLAKGGDTSPSREFDAKAPGAASSAAPDMAGGASPALRPIGIVEAIRANASRPEPAPSPRVTDMSAMRSVRSAALLGGRDQSVSAAAATAGASDSPRVVRSADGDDLKRVRGIGVLIEKRLNALGIVSYAQIADWTRDDVDRVNRSLDFKGRIEREHWVEQARILTAGGQTEFSRRVDKGEVETPKAR